MFQRVSMEAPSRYRPLGHGLRQRLNEHLGENMIEDVELHRLEPPVEPGGGIIGDRARSGARLDERLQLSPVRFHVFDRP